MIVVTGASGFVGGAVVAALAARGRPLRVLLRCGHGALPAAAERVAVGDFHGGTDFSAALAGANVVIHAAARVHVLRETAGDPLDAFRQTNVAATRRLAEQAKQAGVKRFIFISSLFAVGEGPRDAPYTALSPPAPVSPYGRSKLEAEQALQQVCAGSDMAFCIIRPPLIYGPGVKGNLAALARIIRTGLPLPLGGIDNRRSMVGLDNLTSLILTAVDHPAAANAVFMVRDDADVATPALIRLMAQAMAVPARLIAVPPGLLRAGARLVGKGAAADKLLGSLRVDDAATRARLGWSPALPLVDGLAQAFAPMAAKR